MTTRFSALLTHAKTAIGGKFDQDNEDDDGRALVSRTLHARLVRRDQARDEEK